MKFETIRIEGSILSGDILEKIERGDLGKQNPLDFGFKSHVKVKDEIASTWANARSLWQIFKNRMERVGEKAGVQETRKYWIIPLLGFMGYDVERSGAEVINQKSYAISHRAENLDRLPTHIVGFNDSLDKKRDSGGPRMSPHALVQEYLNLTEHLYALVTNGLVLRVLRDNTRLIKLSYLEFNLERMMEEGHFSDFALFYRLVHASRMPGKMDQGAECIFEKYHQDALDAGTRIREGLSEAVKNSIIELGNGFLRHGNNIELKESIICSDKQGGDSPPGDRGGDGVLARDFYLYLLRLIYRVLFLMVIEERRLVFEKGHDSRLREIYFNYYSITQLRKRSERPALHQEKNRDLWISLKNTFRLFEDESKAPLLGIKPLAGQLFGRQALGILSRCQLDNRTLRNCLENLNSFIHPDTGQKIRVNYASLNVEEFGSVYEGLLEFEPHISNNGNGLRFSFQGGDERSSSGSHYTQDELVQPLILNSLEYIIQQKLKEPDPQKALLSITLCDPACGSGHLLLNGARRLGTELARVRTNEDQPAPKPLREAIRDVICTCIYGVDKNPLAVELCKVALWLEAHNPGKPLNFLDHRIRCGDSIVGLAFAGELEGGIHEHAFKRISGDDKEVIKTFSNRNKKERKTALASLDFDQSVKQPFMGILAEFGKIIAMPENEPREIEEKRQKYNLFLEGEQYKWLACLADLQLAQFFIPKTREKEAELVTESDYRTFLKGRGSLSDSQVQGAAGVSEEKKFFHWFLEFPEIMERGGFDCIMGNPPYLGGQSISGNFGEDYLNYIKTAYEPASGCDLVTYFLRRAYDMVKEGGFNALITTNSITEGRMRESGFDVILAQGGVINYARKSVRWPGVANLYVSLFSLKKGEFESKPILEEKPVDFINSFFEDAPVEEKPFVLAQNQGKMFQGSIFLGKGFFLTPGEKERLIAEDPRNAEVIFPVINGKNVNDSYDQQSDRFIINFFDWSEEKAREYEKPYKRVKDLVKPERDEVKRKANRENWWLYAEKRPGLYSKISGLKYCFGAGATTKYLNFAKVPVDIVFTHTVFIYANEDFSNFSVLQSHFYELWARKYSSSLATILRYTPSVCFVNFPFPQHMTPGVKRQLQEIGEGYHEFRRQLMLKLKLGLTDTYNLFHDQALSVERVEKECKQEGQVCKEAYEDILKLRDLHVQLDKAVAEAYGWEDLDMAHGFYQVDSLPENDCIRFTISAGVKREILGRLLELNHQVHQEEEKAGLVDKSGKVKSVGSKKIKVKESDPAQRSFDFN